jgi:hypothetical protein
MILSPGRMNNLDRLGSGKQIGEQLCRHFSCRLFGVASVVSKERGRMGLAHEKHFIGMDSAEKSPSSGYCGEEIL